MYDVPLVTCRKCNETKEIWNFPRRLKNFLNVLTVCNACQKKAKSKKLTTLQTLQKNGQLKSSGWVCGNHNFTKNYDKNIS